MARVDKQSLYNKKIGGSTFAAPVGTPYRITANGSDAGFVLATIVDEKGRWCPLADNNITFSVEGPGSYNFWVIPGKPLTFHAPGDPELAAEGGQMKVAVRSTFVPGTVKVTATSPGLGSGTATFDTVEVPTRDLAVSAAGK